MEQQGQVKPTEPGRVTVRRYQDGIWYDGYDVISCEVPVLVHVAGGGTRRLWAWPEGLDDLVAGHALLDMGLGGRKLDVTKTGEYAFEITDNGPLSLLHEPASGSIAAEALVQCMAQFMEDKGLWDNTGCFHRAGVLDVVTQAVLHRTEDIGRHNCIDRLAGWAARNDVHLAGFALVVSARITASLCAKAMRAGFRFLVTRSAVTEASLEMATREGITLVGFARHADHRLTVFIDTDKRVLT